MKRRKHQKDRRRVGGVSPIVFDWACLARKDHPKCKCSRCAESRAHRHRRKEPLP